jgi:hypothetical protein
MLTNLQLMGEDVVKITVLISLLTVLLMTACGKNDNLPSEVEGNTPPIPQDPYPVELTTEFDDFQYQENEASGQLTLTYEIHTNEDSDLSIGFELFMAQHKMQKKQLLSKSVVSGESDRVQEKILFSEPGEYRLEITAKYGSYGQRQTLMIQFAKNRLSVKSGLK